MFTLQVSRRGFSLWSRVSRSQIARSALRDGHETIQVQRVRFSKPFLSRSRLLGLGIVAGSTYGSLRWLDSIDDEEEEEVVAHTTPRLRQDGERKAGFDTGIEDAGNEEEDALLFLPTGFSRPRPRTYYKGTDPEWQEFRRIAADRKRSARIRGDLVSLVRTSATRNPNYKRHLGDINPEKGAAWVEIKFPEGPPTEFERPGIEVTEDLDVRWTTRPVEDLHHQRLSKVLVPTAAAKTLYDDSMSRASKSWQVLMTYIGWPNHNAETTAPNVRDFFAQSPSSKSAAPAPTDASTRTPGASSSSSNNDAEHPSTTPPPASSPSRNRPSESTVGGQSLDRLLPSIQPPSAFSLNTAAFRQNMMKARGPYKFQPPRGCFIVSGLVQIVGTRARMTLDVGAVYDPKVGKYVIVQANIRNVTEYQQLPKGGSGK